MIKRLYFLLPDIHSTRAIVDELLLARIEAQHIHVMAREGTELDDLPEANLLQKSDIVHGVETGLVIGGITGLLGSLFAIYALQLGSAMGVVVLGCTIFGAVFGVWTAGMIGASARNTRLKEFEQAMNQGKILLMADVPMNKVELINRKVQQHKEAISGGSDPGIPAFP